MTVTVTIYEHRYGLEVLVFSTKELAIAYCDEIGSTYWNEEFPDEYAPLSDIGETYFEYQERLKGNKAERFSLYVREVVEEQHATTS